MGTIQKLCLIVFITASSVFTVNSQTPSWIWAKSGGGSGIDRGVSICVDNEQNVIATGYFSGTASFSGKTLVATGVYYNMFLAKYDDKGEILWVVSAIGASHGYGVTTDNNNNIYVTGSFVNSITFGNTTLNNYSSTYDIFIAKYDKNGALVWVKQAGGTGSDEGYAIKYDGENIVIAGQFQPTAAFDSISITSGSVSDRPLFIAKYDLNGNVIFAKSFGGKMNEAHSLVFDKDKNIIIGGSYNGSITIKGKTYTAKGWADPLLIKLSNNGIPIWSWVGSSTSNNDKINAVTETINSDIIVAGTFGGTLSCGSSTLTSAGGDDAFFCKFDSSGSFIWGKAIGSTNNDQGLAICYISNEVVVTGNQNLLPGKGADIFIDKYDPDGQFKSSMIFGGTGTDNCFGITPDAYGNFFLTGEFTSNISFGTFNLSGTSTDVFIAKYGLSNPPSIIITTQPKGGFKCLGDSITLSLHASGNFLSYQWKFNGNNITGATDTLIQLKNLQLSDAGKYTCTVSDSGFSVTSQEAQISIGTGPNITNQPINKTIEKGKSVQFSVTATGHQLTYQWQKNELDIFGANVSSYTKTNTQYSDSGYYRCILSDLCSKDTSNTAKLTVTPSSGVGNDPDFGIQIFPNPVVDNITIKFQKSFGNNLKIEIFDISGNLMMITMTSPSENAELCLPLYCFSPGIYQIRISDHEYNYSQLFFIK